MWRILDWYLCTDVSKQPIGPIWKGHAVQVKQTKAAWNQADQGFLTIEAA